MNNNRGNNNNNRRRGRGNNNNNTGGGNRPQGGGQQLNRIDSRARGNAPQMLEKFRKLASDAHLNGDRVQAESYLQYADHYFRVIADTRVRQEEQRTRQPGERWQETPEQDDDGLDFSNDADFPAFDRPLVNRPEARREEPRREEPRREEPRREEGREQPRENREPREQRDNRGDRDNRPEREPRENREPREPRDNRAEREPRRDRPEYDQSRREPLNRAAATPAASAITPAASAITPAASAFEVRQGDEGEPIDKDAGANPFVPEARGNRGLRPRGGNRFRRDEEARDGQSNAASASDTPRIAPREGGLDPSMLPPALGPRLDRDNADEGEVRAAPQPAAEPSAEAGEAAPAPRRRGRPRKNPLPVADGAESSTEVVDG